MLPANGQCRACGGCKLGEQHSVNVSQLSAHASAEDDCATSEDALETIALVCLVHSLLAMSVGACMCMQNLWPNLMTEKDEAKVYRALQAELEHLESIVSEGCAALPLLEAKLMSAACDDPSPLIMDWVVLPLLRQRLTAKTEQKAANKASGKQRGSVEKKQDESTPEVTSPSTSSQDSATSTVTPASLQPHTPEAALAAAAAADNAVAAGMKARTFTGQERYGEAAYAEMAAEMLSQQASNLRAHPGGKVPQKDICLAINEDYAAQYEQLLAEEAARAAAESPESSPPPPRPADSACQVAGLNTTAAGCAPAGMAEGTKEKAASLLKGKPDQADAARQSAQEPTCAVYPDDFMVRCVSAAQAAAVTRMCPIRTVQLDDKGAEVTEPADPTAALVNCHSLLHQYIRCPLSQVSLL